MPTLTSPLPIPLPQVPKVEDLTVRRYLEELKSAVEANMNKLFSTDYIHGSRLTTGSITAEQILTSTITTNEVNFTVVGDSNVIATINASTEGGGTLNIDAKHVAISGDATFFAGWAAEANAESDIDVLNTTNAPAEAGADVTADNVQPSAWLSTKIEPGEIRITSGGDTVLLASMLKDNAQWSNDNASGLYLTTTHAGYWDTTNNIWRVWIGSDGVLHLQDTNGDVTLEASDGIQITRLADNTKLALHCYSDELSDEPYVVLFHSHQDTVGNTQTVDDERLGEIIFMGVTSGSSPGASVNILVQQEGAAGAAVPGVLQITTRTSAGVGSNWTFWPDGDTHIPGDLQMSGALTGATIAAALITSGTMSGARVSGGTFGAVVATNLTSLNATNLGSGTVPDARMPAIWCPARADTYSGKTVSGWTNLITFGFNPNLVFVKNMSDTAENGQWAWSSVDGETAASETQTGTYDANLRISGDALQANAYNNRYADAAKTDTFMAIGFGGAG